MPYANQDTQCNDPVFRGRVKQALVAAAIAIQNEADPTPKHLERAKYAHQVLHDPDNAVERMIRGIVSDDADYATDAALDSRAAAVWNAYAMVDP
jgi:hypothetical protein